MAKQSINEFGRRAMGIYAEEVNLNRAVPDLIDGLKPVQRRIMWAASQLGKDFVKTARVVGDVIGKYHPHGDSSAGSAIVTMVQAPTPTISGKGNWGSLIDPAAAMRYTNCTLSQYGLTFLKRDYIHKNVTSFVPNYDDSTYEPVSLPALLPNVLLNGGEGIGVGTTTVLPSFTPESVVSVMVALLMGKKLSAKDYADRLEYSHPWGGHVVQTPENKKAWLSLFQSAESESVQFESKLTIDRDNKAIEIEDWPPGLNPKKFVDKVRALKETDQVFNHKGSYGFRIEMRKDHNYNQFDDFVKKIRGLTRVRRSFKINVTHRVSSITDGVVTFETKFLKVSIPELMQLWLNERLLLEKRSLEFRIKNQKLDIAYSKLLIFASTKLDVVFKALREKDSKAYLVKNLRLTEDQANQILDLKVRQLSKLDQEKIETVKKEQEAVLSKLEGWLEKPKKKVIDDTQEVMDAIQKDRAFEKAKDKEMKVT